MPKPQSNSELIAGLAEEFVARYRAGERPPISEYTARRPELAREIREFFEAVALIENLAPIDSRTVTGPEQPGPDPSSERLDRLGDYRIIREVGRGGMGVVYEAEQLSLGRHVALKVLPAQLLVDDKQRLRFEREAKAAARLHHTNIVPVFGVGHEGGTHYYVMQFIQGKGLDQVLDDLRQLRLQRMLAPGASEVGGRESYGAGSPGVLKDVPEASLAKSLLDGRFHETQIDPALGDLPANAHSKDAPQTVCRGGSPLTPPAGQATAEQPSLGSQTASHATEPGSLPIDRGPTSESPADGVTGLPPRHDRSSGRFHETQIDPALGDLAANPRSKDAPQTVCRGGSPLTPPAGHTTEDQPSLGSRTASHATEPGSLPNDRGSTSDTPAGGVTGLPPRHDRSSGFLLPTDSNSASGSKSRLPTYWESVARIGTQIASALQYAHGQGVLHRDIKPSNLLLDLRATVWITDFGLAKADDQENLTHTGDILGTLRYMAPEAFDGKTDQRSDLYALGLTLYELLAFRPAFDERDRRKLIQQVTEANPVRLERIDKTIPRDLATIVHKAIEREPSHRYQTGQELADDLQRFLNDEPIHARRISSIERFVRWRRRNRGLAAAGMLVAALLVSVAISSTIAAGFFRTLNGRLQETILEKERAQRDAKHEAAENLKLATNEQHARQEIFQAKERETRQLYRSSLDLAQRAWRDYRGVSTMSQHLDHWIPQPGEIDRRGWEWYYLEALQHREVLEFAEAGHAPCCAKFSPDGRWIALGADQNNVRIINAENGRTHRVFPIGAALLQSLDWSPDSQRIAAAPWGVYRTVQGTIHIWDIAEGKEIDLVPLDQYGPAIALRYSHDGQWIAAATLQSLLVFETVSMNLVAQVPGTWLGLAWHPTQHELAVQGQNSLDLRRAPDLELLWSQANAAPTLRVMKGISAPIAWTGDGALLANAENSRITLRESRGGMILKEHAESGVTSLRFRPQTNELAWGGDDATLRIADLTAGSAPREIRGHRANINCIDWSPDGSTLVASANDAARTWALHSAGEVAELGVSRQRTLQFCWSPDSTQIAALTAENECLLFDTSSGLVNSRFPVSATEGSRILWNQARSWILCWSPQITDGFTLYDVSTQQKLLVPEALATGCSSASFSTDGRLLAVGDRQRERIVIWNCDTWQIDDELTGEFRRAVDFVEFGPNSQWLVSHITNRTGQNAPGLSRIWDLSTGRESHFELTQGQVAAWSHSGQYLALAGPPIISILEVPTWRELALLGGHTDEISSISWNPDDTRICTASRDGSVKVWDAINHELLLSIGQATQPVLMATWSPDASRLAWVGQRGKISIADASRKRRDSSTSALATSSPATDSRPTADHPSIRGGNVARQNAKAVGDDPLKVQIPQRIVQGGNDTKSADPETIAKTRFQQHSSYWTRWQPRDHAIQSGGEISSLPDGSIQFWHSWSRNDSYFLRGPVPTRRIDAIRIDALPHVKPWGGVSAFLLSGVRVWLLRSTQEGEQLAIQSAASDYYRTLLQGGRPENGPRGVIDDDRSSFWDVTPRVYEPHWLILQLANAAIVEPGDELLIELQAECPYYHLPPPSRVQISVTDAPANLLLEVGSAAHGRGDLTGPTALIASYVLANDAHNALKLISEASAESSRSSESWLLEALSRERVGEHLKAQECLHHGMSQLETAAVQSWILDLAWAAMLEVTNELPSAIQDEITRRQFQIEMRKADRVVDKRANATLGYQVRADLHGGLREWESVRNDLEQILKLAPNISLAAWDLAPVLTRLGNENACQAHLSRLFARQLPPDEVQLRQNAALSCLLLSRTVETAEHVAQFLEPFPKVFENEPLQAWHLMTRGLQATRRNRHLQAIALCSDAMMHDLPIVTPEMTAFPSYVTAMCFAIQAQAHVGLRHWDEATRALQLAKQTLSQVPYYLGDGLFRNEWHSQLIAESLIAEAEGLLNNRVTTRQ